MRNKEGALLAAAAAFVLVGAGTQANLPAAVARAVEENRPGAEIGKLEIEREGGVKLYDIEFKNGRGEIEVAEDGTVLDVSDIVDIKDIPAAAAAAIQRAAGGRAIKQIEKSEVRAKVEKEGGKGRLSKLATPEYVYEAELSKGEVEVASDGRLIKGLKGEVKP